MRREVPLLEIAVAFLAANFVFARFEKVARASVATGVMQGMFDLREQAGSGRTTALAVIPVEVRTRIHAEIQSGLSAAGISRAAAREQIRQLEALRTTLHSLAETLA